MSVLLDNSSLEQSPLKKMNPNTTHTFHDPLIKIISIFSDLTITKKGNTILNIISSLIIYFEFFFLIHTPKFDMDIARKFYDLYPQRFQSFLLYVLFWFLFAQIH